MYICTIVQGMDSLSDLHCTFLYVLSSLLGLMKDLKTVLLKGIASSKVLLKKTSLRSGQI